ncbi:type I restriction endonuclease [Helicobacter pylori]|uniref:type I restriction endonuclease n=1 Tax=Helicobacter pylori TaxID=210 RepID=UPI00112B28DA|nr:type I restriction endonuclease [Helicobacter pylori]
MKNGIIAYLPHKRTQNARNKKIIFFAIMKPLNGACPTPNKNANQTQKRGLSSWKTQQTTTKRH